MSSGLRYASLAAMPAHLRERLPSAAAPAPAVRSSLTPLLTAIERLAQAQGWSGQYTHNPPEGAAGVHLLLVRECVVFAEVVLDKAHLTLPQEHWLERLRAAQAEVHLWGPQDLPQIRARLAQPRTE